MKARGRSRLFWQELKATLQAGGEAPAIFVDRSGNLCMDGGPQAGNTVPPSVAAHFPPSIVEAARKRAAEVAEQNAREHEKWLDDRRARRAAIEARIDEPGFIVLAGEHTDVVARGTLRECRNSLWRVTDFPRDSYSGRGCWSIVDAEGVEIESGQFTKEGLV